MRCGIVIVLLVLIGGGQKAWGNGLRISNLEAKGAQRVSFSVSWEHSWSLEAVAAPFNHDAVWLFLKYRSSGGAWHHLNLSSDSTAHTATGADIRTVMDGKGVFLEREQIGSGTVSAQVELRLEQFLPQGTYDLQVFGIEMVWVNQESFYLGDAASHTRFRRGDANLPLLIRSEDAIPVGRDSLSLNDTGQFAPSGTIPTGYPKGYKGFYVMKYEITQEQYVDFLNTLTYSQQKERVSSSPEAAAGSFAFGSSKSNRNGIVVAVSGNASGIPAVFACSAGSNSIFNEADDGQNRSCNFLCWADVTAYLDWAALRPITELEFEKSCRGPKTPLAGEFAWGTDKVTDANTLRADGSDSEGVTEQPAAGYGLASHGYNGPQGPLRAGFAAGPNTDRLQSGAGYYGMLEMSGDLWEMCVTVNSKALLFDAKNGDGELDARGYADTDKWPGADGDGAGVRGGAWNSGIFPGFRDLAVSDRFYAGQAPVTRRSTYGGRGGRGKE